jgi:DNA-binding NarL/FixJ family response regulator
VNDEMNSRRDLAVARLVIADDHDLARSGLRSILQSEHDLEIIGEATNGKVAVEICRRTRPDLVLMDLQMPKRSGLMATRMLKQELPDTKIIMLTIYESPRYLSEALKAGAAGYVLKGAASQEIVGAIRKVLRGEPLPPPEALTRQVHPIAEDIEVPAKPPPEHLTPRELEILNLLAEGKTNRQIARTLMVSPGTVKIHVGHIITKLAVSDRTQAVVRAIELGLFSVS